MRLSVRALKRWLPVELKDTDLAEELAQLGFPVDAIEHYGAACDSVLVGEILEKKKHPEADRLSLLKLNVGQADDLQIVCGASNMSVGDFVAVAPVGVTIPGADGLGMKMKKAKIRGEVSFGMCCSESELGLAEESEGIWILDSERAKSQHGKKVSEVFDIQDTIFEVDVTPNRGDALSTRGLARELAAKLNQKLKPQNLGRWKTPSPKATPKIENFDEAYAFATCHFSEVVQKETPPAWQQFLQASGGRSINNLVDITNIVIYDYGHPIHFFDADKIDPQSIEVRRARQGETLQLLDGKTIELHPEDLVIADKDKVLSLAGIMGGAESSVSSSTKNVLLEVASFNPQMIRASLQRHQLHSESGFRFERGVNPHRIDEIVERVIALMSELSSFSLAEGTKVQAPKFDRPECFWNREKVEKKLGELAWDDQKIFDRLRALEYEFEASSHQPKVYFPWYRTDAEELEDVMEDVARLIGYDQLQKKRLEFVEPVTVQEDLKTEWNLSKTLSEELATLGFVETVHWSFANPEMEKSFVSSSEPTIKIKNPIHSERSILRRSLVPQLIERAAFNSDHGEEEIRLFESGPVFLRRDPKESAYSESPFVETWRMAMVWVPKPLDQKRLWRKDPDPFYSFKGICDRMILPLKGDSSKPVLETSSFHPNRQIHYRMGLAGEVHPSVIQSLGLKIDRAFAAEWALDVQPESKAYKRPPAFPSIEFDVNFELESSLSIESVLAEIEKNKPATLESAKVFDIFEGKDLKEKGKRAVTFALRYRHPEQTLEMAEARKKHDKLIARVFEGLGAERIALR